LNTSGSDLGPSLSADGLTLYYASQVAPPNSDVFQSVRASLDEEFSIGAVVENVNSTDDDGGGSPSFDGNTLYLITQSVGGYDLFRSIKNLGGSFDLASTVAELNSPNFELKAVPTADDLGVFIGSSRSGSNGDSVDIWFASRANTAQPFGPLENLSTLNTSGEDVPLWVSADGCVLLLTRPNVGEREIWTASRPL